MSKRTKHTSSGKEKESNNKRVAIEDLGGKPKSVKPLTTSRRPIHSRRKMQKPKGPKLVIDTPEEKDNRVEKVVSDVNEWKIFDQPTVDLAQGFSKEDINIIAPKVFTEDQSMFYFRMALMDGRPIRLLLKHWHKIKYRPSTFKAGGNVSFTIEMDLQEAEDKEVWDIAQICREAALDYLKSDKSPLTKFENFNDMKEALNSVEVFGDIFTTVSFGLRLSIPKWKNPLDIFWDKRYQTEEMKEPPLINDLADIEQGDNVHGCFDISNFYINLQKLISGDYKISGGLITAAQTWEVTWNTPSLGQEDEEYEDVNEVPYPFHGF